MKHLHLKSDNYRYLEQSFKEWLDVLGYSQRTVKGFPLQVRELFHYMEQKNIFHVTQIKSRQIHDFLRYLQTRENLRFGGGLSTCSINCYMSSLNLFASYLNQTGKHTLDIIIRRLNAEVNERIVLTLDEIKELYEATYSPHRQNSIAIGQRDRAIIAIFYGCGLRKEEGTCLDLSDIDLVKRLVFVKKAKGNKQRYVPIATRHCEDIRSYIEEGRNWFLLEHKAVHYYKQGNVKTDADHEAFFLSMQGKRMHSVYSRLYYLREKAGIEKHFSTHNLRHSIATHLLQSGMPIEEIARFLGHSSLESTQIYTHIVNQLNQEEHVEHF